MTGKAAARSRAFDMNRQEFADKLIELEKLQYDWNSYGSDPPSHVALINAELVYGWISAENMRDGLRIEAMADGGIALMWLVGDLYADIECTNSGSVLAVTSDRKSRPRVWIVGSSIWEALQRIKDFFLTQQLAAITPSNDQLLQIATNNPPPATWCEDEDMP